MSLEAGHLLGPTVVLFRLYRDVSLQAEEQVFGHLLIPCRAVPSLCCCSSGRHGRGRGGNGLPIHAYLGDDGAADCLALRELPAPVGLKMPACSAKLRTL